MAFTDMCPSLFLVVCSVWIAREAYRLGIGDLSAPGSGFMIFGAAVLLGLLAIHLSVQSFLNRKKARERRHRESHWRRVVSVSAALLLYIVLFQPLGYLIATFFLLLYLFRSPRPGIAKWFIITGSAAFTSVVTYLVFCRGFALPFPKGVLHFF